MLKQGGLLCLPSSPCSRKVGSQMQNAGKRSIVLIVLFVLLSVGALSACNSDTPATSTAVSPLSTATPAGSSIQSSLLASPTAPTVQNSGPATSGATAPITATSTFTLPPTLPIGTISIGTITIGTIALGTAQPAITSAPPSQGKVIVDNVFRPNPDGYSFQNYAGKKRNGKPVPELAVADLVKMFGETDVCLKIQNGVCTPKQEALDWLDAVNSQPPGGHCEGMAVSSLVLFKGIDSPANYGAGAKTTHALPFTDPVKHLISYYFFLQDVDPVATKYSDLEQLNPSQVLDQVIASMQNGTPDPVNLGFYGGQPDANGNLEGHSIVPYSVEDHGGGIFRIYVYDNNWPDKTDAYMEIDRNKETWTYDLSARDPSQTPQVWTGDAQSHTLAAVPLSLRTGTLVCPWCDNTSGGSAPGSVFASAAMPAYPGFSLADFSAASEQSSAAQGGSTMQIILSGSGHLLITNSKGQNLGFDGKQKINNIPGARVVVPRGGLGVKIQPVYYLPKGDAYTITLQGPAAGVTSADTSSLSLFGQDMAVTLQDIALSTGEQHKLTVSDDAQKFNFVAGNANTRPTFRISTTVKSGPGVSAGNPASYLFQIGNVSVTKGQQLNFSLDKAAGQLDIKSTGGTASLRNYELNMIRTDANGAQAFSQARLTIKTNDTHSLNFRNWTSGQVDVGIDHGSKGTVDATEAVPTAPPAPPTSTPAP